MTWIMILQNVLSCMMFFMPVIVTIEALPNRQVSIQQAHDDLNLTSSIPVTRDFDERSKNDTYSYSIVQVGDDIDGDNYYDFSGTSVTLSTNGQYLAIGAIGVKGYTGHARVLAFDHDSQSWKRHGQDLIGEGGGDEMGRCVSMSNDGMRIAVGSPNHRNYYGHTRVFEFETSSERWVQLGNDIGGEVNDGESGSSLALSGDGARVAIGSPKGNTLTGNVKVFEFNEYDNGWVQLGQTVVGNDYYSALGNALSLSDNGDRIVIGSWLDRENGQRFVGAVSVFEYSYRSKEWFLLGSEFNGHSYYDILGNSVDISGDGNRIIIGIPNAEDEDGKKNVGQVMVFGWDYMIDEWVQIGNTVMGGEEHERFGISVSICSDGNRIVVGSENSDKGGRDAGTTWIFQYENELDRWWQIGHEILGEFERDKSGRSVAISGDGNHVAIGGPLNSYYTGHTRVFEVILNGDTRNLSVPSLIPSSIPSNSPTSVPSETPTIKPSTHSNPCKESMRLLRVEITTDANGSKQNYFNLKKYNFGTGRFSKKVWQNKDLQSETTEIFEKCFPVNDCFIFTMWDRSGDGICCEKGRGSLKVTWDGE